MKPSSRRARAFVFALAAIPLAAMQAAAAPATATWTGASGGDYGVASNWSTNPVVPLNGAGTTYSVYVGPGYGVRYRVLGNQAVDELLLDLNTSFALESTSAIQPTALTVLGRAVIGGSVSAVGSGGAGSASFTALGGGTVFAGNRNAVAASGGGVVRIAAPAFDASGLAGSTILSAAGAGSLLDLSAVQTLNAGQSFSSAANTISATAGGRIDLSGLQTLIAPAVAATLNFVVSGSGSIGLSNLRTVGGAAQNTGYTNFSADAGSLALGPLQSANRLNLSLANGAVATMGGYAGTASITNSTFAVSGGSQLNAAALVGTLDVSGLAGTTFLSAAGTGSVLDLSGLRTLNAGQNFSGAASTISATGGARINLSGVQTLVAPAVAAALNFNVTGGSSIDLSNLQTVGGVTQNSGYTNFGVDGGSVVLGPLQSANRLNLSLANGAAVTMGGYAGTASVTNSTFAVSGGSHLDAAALVGALDVSGLAGTTFLAASGAGSVLDLSGLRTLSAGQNNSGATTTVSATSGSRIDLSGVQTLIAPAVAASLSFVVNGGASLDLSNLRTLGGVTQNTGYTGFSVDGGSVVIGPLQSANRLSLGLDGGAVVKMGGYAGTALITNSTFAVGGGSRLDAAALVGTLDVSGLAGTTFLSATGTGSVLDLSGLRTLNARQNFSGAADTVSASNGGRIDLSGTQTIATALVNAPLNLNAASAGRIDLSSLKTIDTAGGGTLNINVSNGGSVLLAGMTVPARVNLNVADAGSRLDVSGGLALQNGSTLVTGSGATVALRGNFSFQQTVESQVNLDAATVTFSGGGADLLEVGGRHLSALPTNGGIVTANFAIGQLVVGRDGEATVLSLVDAVDNGNRNPSETLYLNGLAGASGTVPADGLHILGGSTLVLGALDLYAQQDGTWLHVNDLFTGGQTLIAYDQGFISLTAVPVPVPEPQAWALWLAGMAAVGFVRRRRRDQS